MELKIRLTGNRDIDEVLKGLPLQINHKVVQQANTSALKALVDMAKLTAPEGPTGGTIDSIGVVKTPFAKASELGLVEAGPRRGRYHGSKAHLIEYGTRTRTNRSGANRGSVAARPFMLPSWNRTKEAVLGSINNFLGLALWRYMKRTIKNG
jgi:hypothetical protein